MNTIGPRTNKRFRVYSIVDSRPLLVDSFDLREQAQRCIDRLQTAYVQAPRDLFICRPRFVLVDAKEQTTELAGDRGHEAAPDS